MTKSRRCHVFFGRTFLFFLKNSWLSARCCRPAKNNILFCPSMNAAAVHTGKLLCLHCRRLPASFFDSPSGIGEFRGGGTADKQAFDVETSLCFCSSRRIKKESRCHLKVDKRFALWPCRTVTFEQPLAYRPPAIRFATFAIPLDESFLTCARSSVSEI
jgi:hypothetical protein